jgi:hypothetical protein
MKLLTITDEQREAIMEGGAPLPLVDAFTGNAYMLLGIEFISDPELGGYTARIPSIAAYGEGDSREEAVLALTEALRGYIETFGR